MATVSLIGIGQKLGRTTGQDVNLGLLRKDGYSRTKAADGYLRVNPYEVEGSKAQDPDEAGSEHRLGDWLNYDQDRLPAASNLGHTEGAGDTNIDWTGATGHDNAPLIVGYKIYVKDTGLDAGSSPTETETSTDPRTSPDQTQEEGFSASAVTDADVNLTAYAGNWVAISLVTLFDDSVTKHEDDGEASAAAGETALTGPSNGILVKAYGGEPVINSVNQTTDPDSCFVGEDVNIRLDVTMVGASTGELQHRVDGGSFVTIDSSVGAGATTLNVLEESGHNYDYRLRYNTGPSDWSNIKGTSATCNNV